MIGCIRKVAPYGPAVGTERAEGSWRDRPACGGPPPPASPGWGARECRDGVL